MTEFVASIGYRNNELEPIVSAETVDFHYGKHHVGYANTLNSLIKGTESEFLSLEQIIGKSRDINAKIFNSAAQLFNHDFYWKCLKVGSSEPGGRFADLIISQFGSLENLKKKYISVASVLFGSGWSWLIEKDGLLDFMNTQNAEIPQGVRLICVIDLWEHAYYIDYRNDRAKYLRSVIGNCINWGFCESQMETGVLF